MYHVFRLFNSKEVRSLFLGHFGTLLNQEIFFEAPGAVWIIDWSLKPNHHTKLSFFKSLICTVDNLFLNGWTEQYRVSVSWVMEPLFFLLKTKTKWCTTYSILHTLTRITSIYLYVCSKICTLELKKKKLIFSTKRIRYWFL